MLIERSHAVRITLSVILDNPAPLILHTNFVSFQVLYMGALVGRAYVNPLDLYEGEPSSPFTFRVEAAIDSFDMSRPPTGTNTLPSEFHYMPSDPNDATAESLLTAYLETKDQIPITIQGDTSSSPYGSLADQALAGLKLTSSYVVDHVSLNYSAIITYALSGPNRFPGQGIPLVHDIRIYLDLVQAFCSNNASFDFSVSVESKRL